MNEHLAEARRDRRGPDGRRPRPAPQLQDAQRHRPCRPWATTATPAAPGIRAAPATRRPAMAPAPASRRATVPDPEPAPARCSGSAFSGQLTGQAVQIPFGTVQVQVTMQNGKITDVQALQLPNDQRRSAQIGQYAAPPAAQRGALRAELPGGHDLRRDVHEHRLPAVAPVRARSGSGVGVFRLSPGRRAAERPSRRPAAARGVRPMREDAADWPRLTAPMRTSGCRPTACWRRRCRVRLRPCRSATPAWRRQGRCRASRMRPGAAPAMAARRTGCRSGRWPAM